MTHCLYIASFSQIVKRQIRNLLGRIEVQVHIYSAKPKVDKLQVLYYCDAH